MHGAKSTNIEKIVIDDSIYSDISSILSVKKKNGKQKRPVSLIVIALSLIISIFMIYITLRIYRLKKEKAEFAATIDNLQEKLRDETTHNAFLSDKLRQTQEDYVLVNQKLEKQAEYYGQLEKENEEQLAKVMHNLNEAKQKIETLNNENKQLNSDKSELREIIQNMAIKIKEQAKEGDQDIFQNIKRAFKKIKRRVNELFNSG